MPLPRTGTETIAICTECGFQQAVSIAATGRPKSCQNCASDLRFEREIVCPHCQKGVPWSPDLGECPFCEGGFAPRIPLRPKPSRSLSRVVTGALDVGKARKWEYMETDAKRRSEALYRVWAAHSRNEVTDGSGLTPDVLQAPARKKVKPPTPWYRRGPVQAGIAAVVMLAIWGGAGLWRSATKQIIQDRLRQLSTATLKADPQSVGSFYGSTLVRFQNSYDVPHEKAVGSVRQLFREYPFVIRFDYQNPVFESVRIGEVSMLVDQEWELRGNEVFSGSERHRLIWKREDGAWRIASQELVKSHWSRKTPIAPDATSGAAAIGVRQ